MADLNFILANTGIQQLKVLAFKKPEFKSDPFKFSALGTPVFTNLFIPGGNFTNLDGKVIPFAGDIKGEGFQLDAVIMTVSATKNVITTAVAGREGTVKEFASDGDFVITIEGVMVGEQQNIYPEEQMNTLIEVCRVPETLKITSEFLGFFDIDEVVITDYNFPQKAGSRNIQSFTISMLSDLPLELR